LSLEGGTFLKEKRKKKKEHLPGGRGGVSKVFKEKIFVASTFQDWLVLLPASSNL
jgi:hypothetical protein